MIPDDLWKPGGTTCPTCHQHAQVYRRRISRPMVAFLLWLVGEWERAGSERQWIDVAPFIATQRGGDYAKIRLWGLAELRDASGEGRTRTDRHWRPTAAGILAANGAPIRSHAAVYNGAAITLTDEQYREWIPQGTEGPAWSLCAPFDYAALRRGDL